MWSVVTLVFASLVGMSWMSTVSAQPGGASGRGAKAEAWAVFKIGDDIVVDKQAELKNLKKKAAEDFKQEMAKYKEDAKAAAKSKDKSQMPKRPVKRVVKVLKGAFKTQQDAEAWKDNYAAGKKDGPSKSNK
jgi:hypothetical protein